MPESEAWAIATQQSHAVGKSPKGYGTPEGRHEAKQKYDTPKDDTKTADPGDIGEKTAELFGSDVRFLAPLLNSFTDELEKIANLGKGPIKMPGIGTASHKGALNATRSGATQGNSPVKLNTASEPTPKTTFTAPAPQAAPATGPQAPPPVRR